MSGKEKGSHVYKLLCPYDPTSPLINDYNAGDLVCSKCGLVVGDRVIDVHQEWRMFHNDERSEQRSRVGDPEINLLGNNNLSTSLAFPKNFNRKIKSSLLNSPLSFSYTGNRTLQPAFRAINDMADRVNATSHIADRACDIYKQVHDLKRHSYYSNFTRAASCLYIACRQEGSPRTLREICAAATVDKKELGRCYMLILKLLGISAGGIDGSDYMNRFCSFLGLDESVKDAAIHISEKTVEMELCSGRSPISIAAAAILMACKIADLNVTQKRISEVAGITYVTVSGCFKLMVPYAEELMPRNSKFPTPTGYELERLLAKKVMYDEKPGEILTTQETIFSSPYADRVEKLLAKNRSTDQLYGKEQIPITTKIPKTNIDKLQKLLQDEYGSAENNSKDNVEKSADMQNNKLPTTQNIGTNIKYNENMNYSTLYKEEMVKLLSQQQLQLGMNDKTVTQSNTFQKEYAEHLAKVLKQNATGLKLQQQNTITPKTTTGKKYENGTMFNEQVEKQTCQCPERKDNELAKQELLKKWNSEEKGKPKESKTKLPYADILTKVRSKKFNPVNQNDPNLISKEAAILKRRSDEVVRFALKKSYNGEQHNGGLKPYSTDMLKSYGTQITKLPAAEAGNSVVSDVKLMSQRVSCTQQYKIQQIHELSEGKYGTTLMPQRGGVKPMSNHKFQTPDSNNVNDKKSSQNFIQQTNSYATVQSEHQLKIQELNKLVRNKYGENMTVQLGKSTHNAQQHKTDIKHGNKLIPQSVGYIKSVGNQQHKVAGLNVLTKGNHGEQFIQQYQQHLMPELNSSNPQSNERHKIAELMKINNKQCSEYFTPQAAQISKPINNQLPQSTKYIIKRSGQQYKIQEINSSAGEKMTLQKSPSGTRIKSTVQLMPPSDQQQKIPAQKNGLRWEYVGQLTSSNALLNDLNKGICGNNLNPQCIKIPKGKIIKIPNLSLMTSDKKLIPQCTGKPKINWEQPPQMPVLKNVTAVKADETLLPQFAGNTTTNMEQQHKLPVINNLTGVKSDGKLLPQCSGNTTIDWEQQHRLLPLNNVAGIKSDEKLIPEFSGTTNINWEQEHKVPVINY